MFISDCQAVFKSNKLMNGNNLDNFSSRRTKIEGLEMLISIVSPVLKNRFYINKICKDFSGKDRCLVSTKINK